MSALIDAHDFECCLSAMMSGMGACDPRQGDAPSSIGFVAGMRIATPMGYVAVERLAAGDLVLTADGRTVRLHGVAVALVDVTPETAPIRIAVGVLENMRPLCVGQSHRIGRPGAQTALRRGGTAEMVEARSLVNGSDITPEEAMGPLEFVHLAFERPEIVLAENVPCETLCLASETAAERAAAQSMLRKSGNRSCASRTCEIKPSERIA